MTENKRFKQLTQKGFTHAFIDIENLDTSYICDNKEDCKNIVKLLNELNDENEQLKHELLCKQLDKAPTYPINCKCYYKELQE